MKRVTICADDFGMHTQVSQAIINLINNRRIQATSCLVNFPNWYQGIDDIANIDSVHLGLHLNFTEGKGLSKFFAKGFDKLTNLLIKSHLRICSSKAIKTEISYQLDNFIQHVGRFPDYIDGHQHVHVFPVIQQALFDVLAERQVNKKIWIRRLTPNLSATAWFKNKMIELSIAYGFNSNITKFNDYYYNDSFAGIYSLSAKENFSALMQLWLSKITDRGLIMCHPAGQSSASNLDFALARYKEYQYLSSDILLDACNKYKIQLTQLPVV